MRKIHETRQFFEDSGPMGHFFEKTKKLVFRQGLWEYVYEVSCVSFFVWPGDVSHIKKYIQKYTDIQVKIEIISSGCLPDVDFENGHFFP